LSRFQNSSNDENETLSYGEENSGSLDFGLISAFWVLIDFIDGAEFHIPSDYPAQIAFFMENELYEIICVETGKEIIVNYALSTKKPKQSNRIIVIDNENQIPKIDIYNIFCFCVVKTDGSVEYYNLE
jgi:hypothetical protein